MTKICKICGKEFIANPKNKIYCSKPCAKEGQNNCRREWVRKHPEQNRIINERYLNNRVKKIAIKPSGDLYAQCIKAGYGYNYGDFMTDRYFGRV